MSSVSVRNQARRGSGEPIACRDADAALGVALTELESRSTPQLQAKWRRLYRAEPPTRLSRDLLLRGVCKRRSENPSLKRPGSPVAPE